MTINQFLSFQNIGHICSFAKRVEQIQGDYKETQLLKTKSAHNDKCTHSNLTVRVQLSFLCANACAIVGILKVAFLYNHPVCYKITLKGYSQGDVP